MRIFIAEDERDLNEIITQKLTAEGYSVDSCYDGAERSTFYPIRITTQSYSIL